MRAAQLHVVCLSTMVRPQGLARLAIGDTSTPGQYAQAALSDAHPRCATGVAARGRARASSDTRCWHDLAPRRVHTKARFVHVHRLRHRGRPLAPALARWRMPRRAPPWQNCAPVSTPTGVQSVDQTVSTMRMPLSASPAAASKPTASRMTQGPVCASGRHHPLAGGAPPSSRLPPVSTRDSPTTLVDQVGMPAGQLRAIGALAGSPTTSGWATSRLRRASRCVCRRSAVFSRLRKPSRCSPSAGEATSGPRAGHL